MPKERLVVILGPTATGKSYCGIELARRFRGEIISGDSMLVYRQMNIGTAKPSEEELHTVPHHLVNILPPDASYSVADFQQQSTELVHQITQRGNLPILVGGTGLYIKALLEDYRFSSVEENPELRQRLETYAREQGTAKLFDWLRKKDPTAAARLHPNDVRRVVRALETALSGDRVSQEKQHELKYDATVFGLSMERGFLYERINLRVDRMLEAGLEEEVRTLLNVGVPTGCLSMKSLGYRQMAEYLSGQCDFATAVDNIKKGTRHFAKRQITWYKKMPYIHWFTVDRSLNYEKIVADMADILEKNVKRM
ncbi:MAG: tRNA (adenosine(37)-N6)-dimethylallyltransferase MiaA [Acidaminococcaceae bacterium]|nr:tRNA (adenosine(37)-N6)-dimethylallyltransferase MiaA [Acidaminococcaceae bacterium]